MKLGSGLGSGEGGGKGQEHSVWRPDLYGEGFNKRQARQRELAVEEEKKLRESAARGESNSLSKAANGGSEAGVVDQQPHRPRRLSDLNGRSQREAVNGESLRQQLGIINRD